MHPCCWCDIDKYNLDKKGTQRIIGNLIESLLKYYDAGVLKKNANNFGNAVHPSMVSGNIEIPMYIGDSPSP